MKQKRKELIETAIKLFADKGFQSTSVQDIVSTYGISKGAFYNYFSSKEELLIEIFKYYQEKLNNKIEDIDSLELSPKEKFQKRIQLQFKYFMKHRDFIVMYFREQNHSINEELRQLLKENTFNMIKKEEELLLSLYGETIKPFIHDMVLIYLGIRNSYMKITVFDGVLLDPDRIAGFLMERIDDIIRGIENSKLEPLITNDHFSQYTKGLIGNQQKVLDQLLEMKKTLETINIPNEKKEELENVIEYLIEENKKTEMKKYIFQGMLTNFKTIKELEPYRQEISKTLKIDLL